MRHTAPEPVNPDELREGLARIPLDLFVIWTGATPPGREGSLASRVLGLVTAPHEPVRLRDLVAAAARLEGERGYRPEAARGAVRNHQRAAPVCYLLVRRLASGDFVAVTDVCVGELKRRLPAGAVVLRGAARWRAEEGSQRARLG